MRSSLASGVAASLIASAGLVRAQYSIDTDAKIKRTAADIAWDMMQYYSGNETGATPGILPGPPPAGDYYWWEAGAMWGTLMDYWRCTGDDSYNDLIMVAMQHQAGPDADYQPSNVTLSLGNDDQGFWGMSAMLAAELKFPDPASDKPGWLALAQAVFNTQANPDRHDDTCNGGLRWQIPFSNNGYDYKNSIANGCFFNLGARLARYTDNSTYGDWAEKTWDWMYGVGYIDNENYHIYDGAHVQKNCTDINKAQFSYNSGVLLQGAAHMYNYTKGSQKWKTRLDNLIDATLDVFFPDNIADEISCEDYDTCTTDMLSFKGYVHRWMSVTTKIAPFTSEKILPVLATSAEAAIKQCTGGDNGRQCGFKWKSGVYDGKTGVGQQMNVLAAVSSLLIENTPPPYTAKTGGTSKGNSDAGTGGDSNYKNNNKPATTADKAGAGILTFLVLATACGVFGWISFGE
ncbi:glycoside hydrolase [Dactylonectria estremocensis]|uniref:Mannan endo-1,6-alpha-mannosidase n=1 Tax=Dactylonectria estremocensis TaxID=1079267 RepID=A0A9P9J9D7_9HYPO|nr:glycoside hydrolase [Dactylonectria estremocensis]